MAEWGNTIVTGGAGFIGSNFIHHILHKGPTHCCPEQDAFKPTKLKEVLNIDALTYAGNLANVELKGHFHKKIDIADYEATQKAISDYETNTIIHFAAESHVDRSIKSSAPFIRTNVQGTHSLLEAARKNDVEHFLHVSTDEVYGSRREGHFLETDSLTTSSPYSASKAASDLLVQSYGTTYGLPHTITRCTNNYGPRQHPEKLLPKVINILRSGGKIPIYGTGKNIRDWLYVKDHCEAIRLLLDSGPSNQIYNVAAQDERTNLEVIAQVGRALNITPQLEFVQDRPGHDWRYAINDSKLRSLGWRPKITFENGLAQTLT